MVVNTIIFLHSYYSLVVSVHHKINNYIFIIFLKTLQKLYQTEDILFSLFVQKSHNRESPMENDAEKAFIALICYDKFEELT